MGKDEAGSINRLNSQCHDTFTVLSTATYHIPITALALLPLTNCPVQHKKMALKETTSTHKLSYVAQENGFRVGMFSHEVLYVAQEAGSKGDKVFRSMAAHRLLSLISS